MPPSTHTLNFDGPMTRRGFWLYVCRIITSDEEEESLYVGMNGDSSSKNASSPFTRMGQHLGNNHNNNQIRKHLRDKHEIEPETCTTFEMVAHGPFFSESDTWLEHKKSRDIVAAMEKALADALHCGGYEVVSTNNSKKHLDDDLWNEVRAAFACHFDQICLASKHSECKHDLD